MKRYGLLGEKLSHSFSKPIHEALGGYPYELIPLSREGLDQFLRKKDFAGVNVTIPYKQTVIPYLDELDPAARAIGVVNTIVNRDGRLYGSNTDFAGMRQTLLANRIPVQGKKVLILGSGGTSRTAHAVLEELGAAEIRQVSREPAAGQLSYEQARRAEDIQLIVNTTPVGMFPQTGGLPLELEGFPRLEGVLDVIYNPLRTRLLQQAEKRGIPCAGGLLMLTAQAKFAAEQFLGRTIPESQLEAVYHRLLQEKTNLVLIGMPASGKTALGSRAAAALGREWVDLDEEIVRFSGKSIPEIFAQEGEAGFRARERRATEEISLRNGIVISTGGGCILDPQNVENLRKNGWLCYNDRPVSLLSAGDGRPLARSREDLAALYQARAPLYQEAADFRLCNDGGEDAALTKLLEAFREQEKSCSQRT